MSKLVVVAYRDDNLLTASMEKVEDVFETIQEHLTQLDGPLRARRLEGGHQCECLLGPTGDDGLRLCPLLRQLSGG